MLWVDFVFKYYSFTLLQIKSLFYENVFLFLLDHPVFIYFYMPQGNASQDLKVKILKIWLTKVYLLVILTNTDLSQSVSICLGPGCFILTCLNLSQPVWIYPRSRCFILTWLNLSQSVSICSGSLCLYWPVSICPGSGYFPQLISHEYIFLYMFRRLMYFVHSERQLIELNSRGLLNPPTPDEREWLRYKMCEYCYKYVYYYYNLCFMTPEHF